MVILAAIVLDVVFVCLVWWASVTFRRRRAAKRRYRDQLASTLGEAARADEAQPAVFDVVASGDYYDWTASGHAAEQSRGQSIGSALDSARQLIPASSGLRDPRGTGDDAVSTAPTPGAPAWPWTADEPPARISDVLRARLTALRDTPGLSVADAINGTPPVQRDPAVAGEDSGASHDPEAARADG